MKNGKMIRWAASITAAVLLLALPLPVCAEALALSPYGGYEYDSYGASHAAPAAYAVSGVYDCGGWGLKEDLNAPSDLTYYNGRLYILDGGNSRILVLNGHTTALERVLDSFHDAQGNRLTFAGAKGMAFDTDGNLYIADTAECRILVFDTQLCLLRSITRPDGALVDTSAPFDVEKVAVNRNGKVYAIAPSINLGILTFTRSGEFVSFYGSNKVTVTADVLKAYFLSRFLTKEQRQARAQITPTIFNNMSIDDEGLVYTVKSVKLSSATGGIVQCLNYKGTNILKSDIKFGEFERDTVSSKLTKAPTCFTDIEVDSRGFLHLLDSGRSRIYQYTFSGKLIGVFGGIGEQKGTFSEPVAFESVEDRIYVLDAQKNTLQEFAPTAYGRSLREAFSLEDSNDREAQLAAWEKVAVINTNSEYPYYGVASVEDARGNYAQAMKNYRIANARTEYSKSFQQYRKQFLSRNTLWILLAAAALLAVITALLRLLKKTLIAVNGSAFTPLENKYTFPLYTCIHPMDGFDQFKSRKCELYSLSVAILAGWFLAETASFFASGFIFNLHVAADYDLSVILFRTVGLFLLFVIGNWSVCTLLDGKGTFKEIFTSLAYALLPYILSLIINIGLSNILTINESVFISLVSTVGILWSAFLIFAAMSSIHQYSFWKMLGSILLTVLSMAILAFILILFYKLIQQVFSTAGSLISEMRLNF